MKGKAKFGWAVKSRTAEGSVITLSYSQNSTPSEAIRAYESVTKKPWVKHVAMGSRLVQVKMVGVKKRSSK